MRILQPPELDTDTLSVIEAARTGHEPNEMARARVRRGIEIKLAAGIALAIAPATSAFAGALKVTAAVVAVGSVVGAGVYVVPRYVSKPTPVRAPAPRVAAHPAPAFIPEAPPAEIAVPERVVTPPRAPSKRRVAAAPAPAPVENASSLKEEIALLGAANAALGRGDFKRALSLLDDYDRRPGAGLLSQERMVTGILAACGAGRVNTAREDARQFRARWPRSPLASRVDGSCAGSADPARPTP
jgi:hypothetical protein